MSGKEDVSSGCLETVADSLIRVPRRGEILVGGLRMCLIEINSGFYTIRTAMEEIVGPVAKTILSKAGTNCGRRFTTEAIRKGLCGAGEDAFLYSIEAYSVAGFGGFHAREVRTSDGEAAVVCRDPATFEAEPYLRGMIVATDPVCDYSRGVLTGFLDVASNQPDLLAWESSCRARGDPECVFEIGPTSVILRKGFAWRLPATPRKASSAVATSAKGR